MPDEFQYDVFLSHKGKVQALAERLRMDGLKVWFDEWVLQPGDSIPAEREQKSCRTAAGFSMQPHRLRTQKEEQHG